MKINILRIILILLLLCTFFIIFVFSSQNGDTSGGISTRITESILEKSNRYNALEEEQKNKVSNRIEKIIRKIAHFSIYAMVGFLLMGLLSTYKLKNKWRIVITILIGILYAISDEVHQSFSPGRTPKITDIYIDTLGIIFGMLIILLIREIYHRYNTKKLQKL